MRLPLRASALALAARRFLLIPMAAAALSLCLAQAQDDEPAEEEAGTSAVQVQIDNQSGRDWSMKAVGSPADGHTFSDLDPIVTLKLQNPAVKKNKYFYYPGANTDWTLPKAGLTANVKNLGKNKKRAMHFTLKEGKNEATFCLYSNGGKLKLFLEKASLVDDIGTEIFELNQPKDGGLVIKAAN